MTPQDTPLILGALGAFFLTLGGGVKWLLTHLDARTKEMQLTEVAARNELSERLHQEINLLRIEIEKMRFEKAIYIRRIYQLEHFIYSQPGADIPSMEGWPPV
jgi:hypothetical protein